MLYFSSIISGIILGFLGDAQKHNTRIFEHNVSDPSSGSNQFEITKEITEFCPSGLTQSLSMAHAPSGCSQSSRFLPQARRIVGSGDENATTVATTSKGVVSRRRELT